MTEKRIYDRAGGNLINFYRESRYRVFDRAVHLPARPEPAGSFVLGETQGYLFYRMIRQIQLVGQLIKITDENPCTIVHYVEFKK